MKELKARSSSIVTFLTSVESGEGIESSTRPELRRADYVWNPVKELKADFSFSGASSGVTLSGIR